MEVLSPVLGICLAIGCATGGLATAYENYRYDRALEDPSVLYLVDEMGNPVRQETK